MRLGELERAVRLARLNNHSRGPVVVLLDADEDCPAAPGSELKTRVSAVDDLSPPRNPEAIRGAKEWLSRNMIPGRAHSSTVDQAALVAGMDLTAAKRWRSFDRLWREIARLIDAI